MALLTLSGWGLVWFAGILLLMMFSRIFGKHLPWEKKGHCLHSDKLGIDLSQTLIGTWPVSVPVLAVCVALYLLAEGIRADINGH